MKWFIPAWNGDWRLTPDPAAPEKRTILEIKRPTAGEKRLLHKLRDAFKDKKWMSKDEAARVDDPSSWKTTTAIINAPLTDVGPLVAAIIKPGPNVITAVKFADGRIEVCETSEVPKDGEGDPGNEKKNEPKPSAEVKELAKKPDAEAAATVKRPTPCCPDCHVDELEVNKPATEVLLSFLNEEEHASWAAHRYIVVRGGITGHRYLIAHRNSEIAQINTRLCFDLDDDQVMHFHLTEVPPEEEVLATKLILEHREDWLRNEATALGNHTWVMKNPFGDGGDGVQDSIFTQKFGTWAAMWLADPNMVLDRIATKIIEAFEGPSRATVLANFVGPHRDVEMDADGNVHITDAP